MSPNGVASAMVLDTTVLNQINRSLLLWMQYTSRGGSLHDKAEDFLQQLTTLLDSFPTTCGCQLYTSDLVLSEQIDPMLPGSRLRNIGIDLLDGYSSDPSFLQRWSDVYTRCLHLENVEADEVGGLGGYVTPDPGIHDLSLVIAALKVALSTGSSVILVSDDYQLVKCIDDLRRIRPVVQLGTQSYETKWLTTHLSLQSLRELHRECGIDNQMWQCVILSYKIHYNNMAMASTIGQRSYQYHVRFARQFLDQYIRDCREKDARDLTKQVGEEFG